MRVYPIILALFKAKSFCKEYLDEEKLAERGERQVALDFLLREVDLFIVLNNVVGSLG